VTVLRAVNLSVSALALTAALAIGRPQVFAPLALCGLVLFVTGAGLIAADGFPLRDRLALACSALTPLAAIGLASAGFAGAPPVAAALPPLALSLAPVVAARRRR
jgi:hypothetical protein